MEAEIKIKKTANIKEYKKYKEQTNILIPWWPKTIKNKDE